MCHTPWCYLITVWEAYPSLTWTSKSTAARTEHTPWARFPWTQPSTSTATQKELHTLTHTVALNYVSSKLNPLSTVAQTEQNTTVNMPNHRWLWEPPPPTKKRMYFYCRPTWSTWMTNFEIKTANFAERWQVITPVILFLGLIVPSKVSWTLPTVLWLPPVFNWVHIHLCH